MRSFLSTFVLAAITSSSVFAAPSPLGHTTTSGDNFHYSTGHHGRGVVNADVSPKVYTPPVSLASAAQSQDQHRRYFGDVVNGDALASVKNVANTGVANANQSQNQRRGDFGDINADVISQITKSANVGVAQAGQSQARTIPGYDAVDNVVGLNVDPEVKPGDVDIVKAYQTQNQRRVSGVGKKRTDDPSQLGSYQTSVATVFVEVQGKVKPVCDQLVAAVHVGITVDVVLPIINELKADLNEALAAIQCIAANPGAGVFYYGGKYLALQEVVALIVTLFATVITALNLALHAVGTVEAQFLVPLFIEVGVLLGKVVCATFAINGGIQALIAAQLVYLHDTLVYLSLTSVCASIGIKF
ncbi:hypothetical protein BDN72DRAFT_293214 [Pluteus cervinus]|uniref:Uncharacterized protein n=1 Tax=Pluteus cervinus TaxID=181527 RepID=A0ACD3ADW4_9AGAR|nr:hypothetical protein BDN72DRAFT_293214 [Pluteus cervinus]